MKKYIALIAALFLTLAVFAVVLNDREPTDATTTSGDITEQADTEETTGQTFQKQITIGYYEDKSLNPFKTDSPVNRGVSTLLYDSLYILDETYCPQPVIASSSEKASGKLTVYITPEIYFTSGSPLTASDVVYSFELAKNSDYYSQRLKNFTGAAAGVDCVVFTLSQDDVFSESCLTFPIVQSGTGENDIPVGSGRYTLQSNKNEKFLTSQETTARSELMNTDKILLAPITSENSELYLLQTGDLSYFFDDLSDGEYTKISASMQSVPLNNFVYLGFNSQSPALSDKAVIEAVELCVDKATIADSAYNGICRIADTPFNPYWYALSALKTDAQSYSSVKAAEALQNGGYIYAYSNNRYRSKNFVYLELTMLVNEENKNRVTAAKTIADDLRNIGINVTLNILPFDEYEDALENGEYDIYLGEVKLTPNMDLSCFFSESGSANYGIDTSSTVAAAYFDFAAGKIDISTFTKVFLDAKPFVPVCYRSGMAYYTREITFEGTVTEYEPFLNAYSWEVVGSN